MSLLIKALDKAEKDQAQFGKSAKVEPTLKLSAENSPPASEWALTPNQLASNQAAENNNQATLQSEQDLLSAKQRVLAANVFTAKQTNLNQADAKNANKTAIFGLLALVSLFFVGVGGYAYFVNHAILNGTPLSGLFAKPTPLPQIKLAQPDSSLNNNAAKTVTPSAVEQNNTVATTNAPESVMAVLPAAAGATKENSKETSTANSTVSANDLVTQAVEISPGNRVAKMDAPNKIVTNRKKKPLEQNELVNEASILNQDAPIAYKTSAYKASTTTSKKALLSSRSSTITVTQNKPSMSVSPTLQSAYLAYTAGEDVKAQQLYKQVLQTETRNVDAMLGLAAIAQKQNRMDDAAGWYKKVLVLDPKNAFALASLANSALSTQLQSNGLEDIAANESRLKNLIAQQPDNANLQAALGSFYADQNQWSSAQQAYFEAYRLAPNNPDFAFNLAASLDQMGKPKLALPYYKRALEQQLQSANSLVDVATIKARINAIQ